MRLIPDAVLPAPTAEHRDDAVAMTTDAGDTHVASAALTARQVVDDGAGQWGEHAAIILLTDNVRDFKMEVLAEARVLLHRPDGMSRSADRTEQRLRDLDLM
ncbi:MAG: hypothetical protein JJE52_03875 [Acidimicrobiia bacterium]|nr:hypothetical protein [Acidimicrobiia bacterium]